MTDPGDPGRPGASAGFDRLRPHRVAPVDHGESRRMSVGRDAHGKRALYSGVRPPSAPTANIAVRCSRCGGTSTVSLRRAVWLLTGSLHLPLPVRHPSFVRCPACERRSWVRLGLQVRNRP